MAVTTTANLKLQKVDSTEKLSAYPAAQQANMDLLDTNVSSAASKAEYDLQAAESYYAGRNLIDLLGATSFDDCVSKLHARVQKADYSGLRRMDYLPVTPTSTTVNRGNAITYRISDFDRYYRCGDTATPHNICFVPDVPIDMTGSAYDTNTSSYIMWNTTNTNQGTADEPSPYLASNLHKWELEEFLPALPTSLQDVLVSPHAMLETRYSASGTLTDSNGWAWKDLGKVWSPSETEVYGTVVWGTKGYSAGRDEQLGIFRCFRARGMRNGRYDWWLRSVRSGSSSDVCCVNYFGDANCYVATFIWVRPLPCFLVG